MVNDMPRNISVRNSVCAEASRTAAVVLRERESGRGVVVRWRREQKEKNMAG